VTAAVIIVLASLAGYFVYTLRPISADKSVAPKILEIKQGDGFRKIVSHLTEEKLIRSRFSFELLSLMTGSALHIKAGVYKLSPAMSSGEILGEIVSGTHHEVSVVIPEGAFVFDADKILSEAGVIRAGELVNFAVSKKLEGRLFPDTYRFFTNSEISEVAHKFQETFDAKAAPFLVKDQKNFETNLILASLVEKEIPEFEDQRLVAGILKKRLQSDIPLQVDATICYIKMKSFPDNNHGCYPFTPLDFKLDSPYNTYLHKGLPPGPIGSPGVDAIRAVLEPKNSPYWFYLSDPKTKKTVFGRTLEEHNKNRAIYLNL